MTIRFETKPLKIGSLTILLLPKSASTKLPSRGMVMVEGIINDFHFQAPLEPDGKGSHWFVIDKKISKATEAAAGKTVTLAIKPIKNWPNPEVPTDLKNALADAPQAQAMWLDITPMARWDWIRWIRSTKNAETRKKRIQVALSKLMSGERRPCCFNRSMCTDPSVSNNGVLLDPE